MFPSGNISSSTRQLWDYQHNIAVFSAAASSTMPASSSVDVFTLVGKGIIGDIYILLALSGSPVTLQSVKCSIVIDGIVKPLTFTYSGINEAGIWLETTEVSQAGASTGRGGMIQNIINTKFKTSVIIRATNLAGTTSTSFKTNIRMNYYT